ncbi:MAG TPA: cobalamin-independent methionine synthase II family protein [Candidatus Binatia bacterium]|nr:cobalamin-independent methionine synthase II family protein [Candidatus Binatia bacterium]
MERSENRILTTHAGSLPRPPELLDLLVRRSRREPLDERAFETAARAATRRAIERQLACGIDVGNDGEQPRESFFTHVQHRMSGFGGASQRPVMRDIVAYRSFLDLKLPDFSRTMVNLLAAPKAVGEVRSLGTAAIEKECSDFADALAAQPGPARFVETFLTAPSPGIVAAAMQNEHYPRLEDYVRAVAAALRPEYEAIAARGIVLQLDCPDLAMERHTLFADRPLDEFLAFVDVVVDAINDAIAGIAPERVRMHVCFGNYEGPHTHDVDLAAILPHLYRARVGAVLLPFANPRHAHELGCLEREPLPARWLLVAGVIDTTTNYVEHPEVVAERLERAARAVGDPRRVLAGTDCGFATAAGLGEVAEEVVWEKLRALRAGADIASRRLL